MFAVLHISFAVRFEMYLNCCICELFWSLRSSGIASHVKRYRYICELFSHRVRYLQHAIWFALWSSLRRKLKVASCYLAMSRNGIGIAVENVWKRPTCRQHGMETILCWEILLSDAIGMRMETTCFAGIMYDEDHRLHRPRPSDANLKCKDTWSFPYAAMAMWESLSLDGWRCSSGADRRWTQPFSYTIYFSQWKRVCFADFAQYGYCIVKMRHMALEVSFPCNKSLKRHIGGMLAIPLFRHGWWWWCEHDGFWSVWPMLFGERSMSGRWSS